MTDFYDRCTDVLTYFLIDFLIDIFTDFLTDFLADFDNNKSKSTVLFSMKFTKSPSLLFDSDVALRHAAAVVGDYESQAVNIQC